MEPPTRIRVGSHADIARQLAPAEDRGLTLRELAADGFATSAHRPVVTATGEAGTVSSVIHSWYTRRSRATASVRDSWPSHRCFLWIRTIGRATVSIPSNRRQHGRWDDKR